MAKGNMGNSVGQARPMRQPGSAMGGEATSNYSNSAMTELLGSIKKIAESPVNSSSNVSNPYAGGDITREYAPGKDQSRGNGEMIGQQGGNNLPPRGGVGNYQTMPSNLMVNNPYMNFGPGGMSGGAMMNPWSGFFQNTPYGGGTGDTETIKGLTPTTPAGPKWGTGNEALSHINSQLTRGLEGNELDFIKKNIGYQGGGVDENQMSTIMDLIRQHKPGLLRGMG